MIYLDETKTFVAYSLPGLSDHQLLIHDDAALTDEVFIMDPFQDHLPQIRIHSDPHPANAEFLFEPLKNPNMTSNMDKLEYMDMVAKAKQRIVEGSLEKVVLSRKVNYKHTIVDVYDVFQQYKNHFKNQFVYLLHSPASGTWLGASPEHLVEKTNKHVKTVALAGTLKKSQKAASQWTQKELDEQGIIRKYFEQIFIKNGLTFTTDETYTSSAGGIVHLKNNYLLPLDTDVVRLISLIHPSPAICGTPLEYAKKTISDLERYDREYYCGYVGLRTDLTANFFVNIRCMKLWSTGVEIFVGGGITKDSDPTHEWDETELKANVLKGVLDQLRNHSSSDQNYHR